MADHAEQEEMRYCLLTNDVEETSIWFNRQRRETGLSVVKEGLPLLLEIYRRSDIKSTFFFVGKMAKEYPQIVKMILPDGHEVGSHGWSHEVEDALDRLPFKQQVEHLRNSKSVLEDISGKEVVTFRAPSLRINHDTAAALAETGYRVDSSVPSQRFDFFLSHGSRRKLRWFFAPRLPYRTAALDLTRRGKGSIVEVPLSAFFLPFVGTTMRLLPRTTQLESWLHHLETRLNNKPVVFDIHPNEFIDESREKRMIQRRSRNLISFILADLLRARLKIKNAGPRGVPLYTGLIDFFLSRRYRMVTIREYCRINGWL